jgi:hypothetical protein
MFELLPLFSFWDDFGLIVGILVFFALYNALSGNFIRNNAIALIVSVLIFFLLVVPYDFFKYLLFVILFLGGLFATLKPEEW